MDSNINMNSLGFIDWMNIFIHSLSFQQLIVYNLAAFLGLYIHYWKKILSKEIEGSFNRYMFKDHPLYTFNAVIAIIVSSCTYIFSGSTASITWEALLGLAITTGYSIDSIVNKSKGISN